MTQSVLLLTAHPDDECMFFTPAIRKFIAEGFEVELLCLSTGDYYGKGVVRRQELERSAKVLGISTVRIINDKKLQDGLASIWNPKDILRHVRKLTQSKRYSAIMTFDDQGVSGHSNHCSISRALRVGGIDAWRLESLPVWLKYTGVIGSMISAQAYTDVKNDSMTCTISLSDAYKFGYCAMLKHDSQMAWFRRLYLIFSIYMTFNLLRKQK